MDDPATVATIAARHGAPCGRARSRRPLRRLLDAAGAARSTIRRSISPSLRQRARPSAGVLPRHRALLPARQPAPLSISRRRRSRRWRRARGAAPRRLRAAPLPRPLARGLFCDEVRPGVVVGDENPLRETEAGGARGARRLRAPLWTVDADVVVPSGLLGKRAVRRAHHPPAHPRLLGEFLAVPIERAGARRACMPRPALLSLDPAGSAPRRLAGRSLRVARRPARGGTHGGAARAQTLPRRAARRLHDCAATGPSSPPPVSCRRTCTSATSARARSRWRCEKADAPRADREAYLEELIVRRELAINFVALQSALRSLEGCEPWARHTLAQHARDPRAAYRSTERSWSAAESPDPLWNAAQRRWCCRAGCTATLRMYWAKKILEWTPARRGRLRDRRPAQRSLRARRPRPQRLRRHRLGHRRQARSRLGPERPILRQDPLYVVAARRGSSTPRRTRRGSRRWSGGDDDDVREALADSVAGARGLPVAHAAGRARAADARRGRRPSWCATTASPTATSPSCASASGRRRSAGWRAIATTSTASSSPTSRSRGRSPRGCTRTASSRTTAPPAP